MLRNKPRWWRLLLLNCRSPGSTARLAPLFSHPTGRDLYGRCHETRRPTVVGFLLRIRGVIVAISFSPKPASYTLRFSRLSKGRTEENAQNDGAPGRPA